MTPIKTRHTTRVLGAPQGWNANAHGPCNGLPVLFEEQDGLPSFFSYWRPSWRERLVILFGRTVRLCVTGTAHPPVHIDTEPH